MKFQLTAIGCDETDFGTERVILEDDQLGELTVYEIELDSFEDIFDILDDADTVQFETSRWEKYDGEVTVICGKLF